MLLRTFYPQLPLQAACEASVWRSAGGAQKLLEPALPDNAHHHARHSAVGPARCPRLQTAAATRSGAQGVWGCGSIVGAGAAVDRNWCVVGVCTRTGTGTAAESVAGVTSRGRPTPGRARPCPSCPVEPVLSPLFC